MNKKWKKSKKGQKKNMNLMNAIFQEILIIIKNIKKNIVKKMKIC